MYKFAYNYDPEDVRSSEVIIASISGSGVAFGILPHEVGVDPEVVAIAPKLTKLNDLRIGETVDIGFVLNFPEHLDRVRWRAVAIYRKTDGQEKPVKGTPKSDIRRDIEIRIAEIMAEGEVWNRGELYRELFGEPFLVLTASEAEKARYEAVGHSLSHLHDIGSLSCAKVYGPGKKNATNLYYAKTTLTLGKALMGMPDLEEESEPE